MSFVYPKSMSWDVKDYGICMVYVDQTDTVFATCHRSGLMQLASGRPVPGWDTPVALSSSITLAGGDAWSQVNVGTYPSGITYMGMVSLANAGYYSLNNSGGFGSAWSTPASITYHITGHPDGGIFPKAMSAGDGLAYFTHPPHALVWQRPDQPDPMVYNTAEDGVSWSWAQYGDNLPVSVSDATNLNGWLPAYQRDNMVKTVTATSYPYIVQEGMCSPMVRLADGTLCQIVYTSRYYKWRQATPTNFTFDTISGTATQSQNLTVPVPATGTISEVWLDMSGNMEMVGMAPITGVLPTPTKPASVKFTTPTLRAYLASRSNVPCYLLFDVTVQNAAALTITVGSSTPTALTHIGGVTGSGRFGFQANSFFPIGGIGLNNAQDNWSPATPLLPDLVQLSGTDALTITSGGIVTLPITYAGSADNVTINSLRLVIGDSGNGVGGPFVAYDPLITWSDGTFTESNLQAFAGIAPSVFVPVLSSTASTFTTGLLDNTAIAQFQGSAGGNHVSNIQFLYQPLDNNGMTPSGAYTTSYPCRMTHWDFFSTTFRFGYNDANAFFRIVRSRDNGAHWEFANDGAPISGVGVGVDNLRQFQNTPGVNAVMPLLAAAGDYLMLGFVENGAGVLLMSADRGDTWN